MGHARERAALSLVVDDGGLCRVKVVFTSSGPNSISLRLPHERSQFAVVGSSARADRVSESTDSMSLMPMVGERRSTPRRRRHQEDRHVRVVRSQSGRHLYHTHTRRENLSRFLLLF